MIKQVPILMYHSISASASLQFKRWTVTPHNFRSQLMMIRSMGFTPMTISDYVLSQNRRNVPSKPILITFDDGFEDFYFEATPILQDLDMPATVYVTTGYVGKTSLWLKSEGEGGRKMMSAKQIVELNEGNIEIGAHTVTHPQLDVLIDAIAKREIIGSRVWLESVLGERVRSFAYPHGYHSKRIRQLVIESGFTSACGVKHAMSHTQDDRFSMARIIVEHGTTIREFAHMLTGENLDVAPKHEKISTRLWRTYRQQVAKMKYVAEPA